jgi:hypothetical protein
VVVTRTTTEETDMLVHDITTGDPVDVQVRLRDRVSTRLHADRIDLELARGASPDTSVELALRARALTSRRSRRGLAGGLRRVVDQAESPSIAAIVGIPVNRSRVLGATAEIEELRAALLARGPVGVQGVAQTKALLTHGWGELYNRQRSDTLAPVIRRAIDALDLRAA